MVIITSFRGVVLIHDLVSPDQIDKDDSPPVYLVL